MQQLARKSFLRLDNITPLAFISSFFTYVVGIVYNYNKASNETKTIKRFRGHISGSTF